MTNKEILAELHRAYHFLEDIRENGCQDHCNGQLDMEKTSHLEKAMLEIEDIYYDLYHSMSNKDIFIREENGQRLYIGEAVNIDYVVKEKNNNEYYLTGADLNYYWWFDKFLLARAED